MNNKKAEVIWCRKHFRPRLDFTVGQLWFGVIPQAGDTFAIKQVNLALCERTPDEGAWLAKGCETESGCCYLILSALDEGPEEIAITEEDLEPAEARRRKARSARAD